MIPLSFLHMHVHYTLLDVIPLDTTTRACLHTHHLSAPFAHVGVEKEGLPIEDFLNVQANFLCLQPMTMVNHTPIITKRRMASSHLPTFDSLKVSILHSRQRTRWPAAAVCHQFMTASPTLHHPRTLRAFRS